MVWVMGMGSRTIINMEVITLTIALALTLVLAVVMVAKPIMASGTGNLTNSTAHNYHLTPGIPYFKTRVGTLLRGLALTGSLYIGPLKN